MKILSISAITPLPGLKRENDIVLRIQDHLQDQYQLEFTLAKYLPFFPLVMKYGSTRWKRYRDYINRKEVNVQGYSTLIYPWLMMPTSNFWVNYLLIPANFFLYVFKIRADLKKKAKTVDLILAQNSIPDALVAFWISKIFNKPFIVNLRGDFNSAALKLPMTRFIYKKAVAVITHSPTIHRKFSNSINIRLLLHPVDQNFFSNHEKPLDSIQVISVCRLLKLKNIHWILDVLFQVKKLGYEFNYHIVGDGPELKNLKEKTRDLDLNNEVIFHGYQTQEGVVELLKSSHIFAMPSYPETLGRSFLEAAASGCLCLGHKGTGVDGLFKHHESAIFVDKGSVENEFLVLIKNLSQVFEKYTSSSRKIVEEVIWPNVGHEYFKLYTESLMK